MADVESVAASAVSAASALSGRSLCAVCRRQMPLRKDGAIRVHDPVSRRCPGGGNSPFIAHQAPLRSLDSPSVSTHNRRLSVDVSAESVRAPIARSDGGRGAMGLVVGVGRALSAGLLVDARMAPSTGLMVDVGMVLFVGLLVRVTMVPMVGLLVSVGVGVVRATCRIVLRAWVLMPHLRSPVCLQLYKQLPHPACLPSSQWFRPPSLPFSMYQNA